jgi:hypothetical protein
MSRRCFSNAAEGQIDSFLQGSATAQHLILRGEHFRQRPLHEDDAILVARRKRKEKPRDHFDHLTFALRDAGRIVGKLLDPLPLQVAARVVGVGVAFPIRERSRPPATSICIMRDVPERGNPETIVIMRSCQWCGRASPVPE